MQERLFTIHQVADLLATTAREVQHWIAKGWLASKPGPDGIDRVGEKALIHFLKGRGIDMMQLMVSTAARHDARHDGARGERPRVLSAFDGPAGPSLDEEVANALAAREMLTGKPASAAPASQAMVTPAASAKAAFPASAASAKAAFSAPPATTDARQPPGARQASPSSPVQAQPAGHGEKPASLSAGNVLGAPSRGSWPAGAARPSYILNEDEVAALLGAPLDEPARNPEHPAPLSANAPSDAPAAGARESLAVPALSAEEHDGPFVGGVDEIEPDDEGGLQGRRHEEPATADTPHNTAAHRPADETHGQVPGTPDGDARATHPPAADATLPPPDEQSSARVAQVLSAVLDDAVRRGATHVHLQFRQAGLTLRMRLAGRLREKPNFRRIAASPGKALADRLLGLAGLGGADLASPRRGEFTHRVDGRTVRMTLSSFPTTDGPRLVISLPGRPRDQLDLAALGARPQEAERIRSLLAGRPGGLLLVCGPTRSDRDDVLAALAGQLAGMGRDVLAIVPAAWGACQDFAIPGIAAGDDSLPGASNSRVDPVAGYRFRDAAGHLAGQDADAIVLAELPDPLTAAAALEAAQAETMVVAGVAAATAAEALGTLAEMNVESWPLAAMLRGAIVCRTLPRLAPAGGTSGRDGAIRLISLLEPSRELVRLVRAAASAEAIAAAVPDAGMAALLDLAAGAVRDGILSADDVPRLV